MRTSREDPTLELYDFDLPDALIAREPASPRDASRLLVVDRAAGSWRHERFSALPDLPELQDGRDTFVANNSRVIRARLKGHRVGAGGEKGGKTEFFLLEELSPRVWEGLFHASAKHQPGLRFEVPTPDGQGLRGTLLRGERDSEHGTVVAEFDRDPIASGAGSVPLPPYLKRAAQASDEVSYQTIYAKTDGSAAAPTAGLHFTEGVRERLRKRGSGWEEVTLHVGLGTFRPLQPGDLELGRLHEERYEISEATARALNGAKREGRRLIAVGTTSVRTLESAAGAVRGEIRPGTGRTSIFIRPGYQFLAVDRLLTNFHLPRSSLLMLVSAFAGRDLVLAAYAEAVREKYRFYSYGDAMLVV